MEALDVIRRASLARVGPATSTESLGGWRRVRGRPADLAAAAGLSPETYALARLVASEAGGRAAPAEQMAIAEVGRNEADRRGISILRLLTRDESPDRNGYFGQQSGRWAATTRDPNGRAVAAARIALEGSTELAQGAGKFFHPRTQDAGLQGGRRLRRNAAEVIGSWGSEGWQWIGPLPGVASYRFMALRLVGGIAQTGPALEAITAGRAGRRYHGDEPGPSGGGGAGLAGLVLLLATVAT